MEKRFICEIDGVLLDNSNIAGEEEEVISPPIRANIVDDGRNVDILLSVLEINEKGKRSEVSQLTISVVEARVLAHAILEHTEEAPLKALRSLVCEAST